MSILSTKLPHGFSLLTQSMIQASDLPLDEALDCSIIADGFTIAKLILELGSVRSIKVARWWSLTLSRSNA